VNRAKTELEAWPRDVLRELPERAGVCVRPVVIKRIDPDLRRCVDVLEDAYPTARRGEERTTLVYHCIPYARTSDEAFQLGLTALNDRARPVRHQACGLLAYSLRRDALQVSCLSGSTKPAASWNATPHTTATTDPCR
jgi:hypothetical protein